jgi:dipeptidyl aminopeptidase/acylaminoacyl peptidase
VIWFDEEAARLQASIDASLPGTQNVFDPSGERTLVQARSDTNPGEYYIYSKDRKVLEQTGIRTQPQFDPRDVRPTKSVVWKARDGVPIDGYLTLPARRGDGPVPLILHPHGGPWARDNGYFNPEVQFMADRGFAVLRPNFRGSTGYGANHLRLGYKQWGATMVDDMLDGIDWCIQQGIADPARIGVYGASYGGYAALMALVRRPDLFKWGVNYVGVTDLVVHQDTQPAQLYGGFFNLAQKLTGDQKADAPLFEEYSPARHVAKIAAPVFHAYGGSDMNVAPENGNVIRSAFERAKKPFEWMFVADEAHGYRQDVNVFEFYRHFEKFMLANTPPRRSA